MKKSELVEALKFSEGERVKALQKAGKWKLEYDNLNHEHQKLKLELKKQDTTSDETIEYLVEEANYAMGAIVSFIDMKYANTDHDDVYYFVCSLRGRIQNIKFKLDNGQNRQHI